MVWNGRPREWRLSAECHDRPEWIDAAAAFRLRWQSPRHPRRHLDLPAQAPPLRAVRAFFAVIVAAAVLALGACNLDAYPCRGP